MKAFYKRLIASLQKHVRDYEWYENHLTLSILKAKLPHVSRKLHELGGRLLTMVGTDERELHGHFKLYYVFAFDQEQAFVTLCTHIAEDEPTYPSVTPQLPACDWYEREVHDLLGLKPLGHPNLKPLMLHEQWPTEKYPLRKDYPSHVKQPHNENQDWFSTTYEGEGVTQIPVGPIHAGIIEPGHFRFGVIGDTIIHLDAQLFFKHRGLEKKSEEMPVKKALFLSERICGVCALSHATSFAQAIENITNTTIPQRAQYLRTLFLELERLYNHIADIGDICSGAGFHFGTSHGARLKEELQQLNEQITGHRFLRGVISLGGVRHDLSKHELAFIHTTLAKVKRDFRELINILLDHEITLDRMATTGRLHEKIANELEVVGPAGRASGRTVDIRKSHPYLLYNQLSFEIPHYSGGDVLARVHVRIDEVFESFSLIQQLLKTIPDGHIQVNIQHVPAYKVGIGWTESPLGENVHWVMTGPDETIYRYRVRSAAYSNWPAVPHTVKGNIVPDFPIINKSFELCYACCDR